MRAKSKNIVFTGGGTAGHVFPNFPLIEELLRDGYQVLYVGSSGIEGSLVREREIDFRAVVAGKLRRYFSWKNFLDIFKVGIGFWQSLWILLSFRPALIFSKGGFVSVPVCLAGRVLGIPVFAHESDMTPGLATKIVARFAHKIFCAFSETTKYLPGARCQVVGLPLRRELKQGQRSRGLAHCGFDANDGKAVLLIMGGSQGSQLLNDLIVSNWLELKQNWRVVHLTGQGKETSLKDGNYKQFPFVGQDLPDLLAAADVVVSRAGATSLFELLALQKPMLLIPLVKGSRGDQVLNAEYFAKQGFARVLAESELTGENLLSALAELWRDRSQFIDHMRGASSTFDHAVPSIIAAIKLVTESNN